MLNSTVQAQQTSLTHIGENEPGERDILVDHLLQVGHLIGGRAVQENVEGDGRALVLDLVDQRGETDGVVNLQSYSAFIISLHSVWCIRDVGFWRLVYFY